MFLTSPYIDQAIAYSIGACGRLERPMILSSTTRRQGQRGCRPFPLHPQSPPNRLRFASDNLA